MSDMFSQPITSPVNFQEIAKFDYRIIDPAGLYVPLQPGSITEAVKEPAWHESLMDPRSLAVFCQFNALHSQTAPDKQRLIQEMKRSLLNKAQKSKETIPFLDMKMPTCFGEDFVPIYNDLIVIARESAFLVTLFGLGGREIRIEPEDVEQLERHYPVDFSRGYLVGIAGNVKRALAFEDTAGYLQMLVDAGRLAERVRAHCQEQHRGCQLISLPALSRVLNRLFGFSGYYYSFISHLLIDRRA